MNELSWRWIALMAAVPLPLGALVAWPLWHRRETILGNVAGSVIIFGAAFAAVFRESTMLDALQQACLDAGFVACFPHPSAFARYAIYAFIALAEVIALFIGSLSIERHLREQQYAPEWRR